MPPACSHSLVLTNVASKLLWQAVILPGPSWCAQMLNFHHYLQVSHPISPLRHRRPEPHGSQWEAFPLYALFKPSPERWKNTWQRISGLLAATQHAHNIGEDTQMTQKTTHFGKKTGLRASCESTSDCPWQTSGPDPPGWSKQHGALRRFIWMVDSLCTTHPSCSCPYR